MSTAPYTDQTQVTLNHARKVLRPLLHQGKTESAKHQIRILLDNSGKPTYTILRILVALLDNNPKVRELMLAATLPDDNDELRHTYGQLLVDAAICNALNGGDPAIIQLALNEAEHGLYNRTEEVMASKAAWIIAQLTAGDISIAHINYIDITSGWLITRTETVLQWKLVLDLAMYRVTGDPTILAEIMNSPALEPFAEQQAHDLERKFQAKAWVDRQLKWIRRAAQCIGSLKRH